MLLLAVLLWCVIGAFSAGVAYELNNERHDPTGVVVMTMFAPVTLLYVVGFLAMKAGQSVIINVRNR